MTARAHGFTLLEMAFVVAIIGIVLAVAVPSYSHFLARQQLRAAGQALSADLRMAREDSVRIGQQVFVSYRPGSAWCWGVNRGRPCDCAGGVPACTLSRGTARDYPQVELAASTNDLIFEPPLGAVALAGATDFRSRKGHSLRVQVSAMGRALLCGPDSPKSQPC